MPNDRRAPPNLSKAPAKHTLAVGRTLNTAGAPQTRQARLLRRHIKQSRTTTSLTPHNHSQPTTSSERHHFHGARRGIQQLCQSYKWQTIRARLGSSSHFDRVHHDPRCRPQTASAVPPNRRPVAAHRTHPKTMMLPPSSEPRTSLEPLRHLHPPRVSPSAHQATRCSTSGRRATCSPPQAARDQEPPSPPNSHRTAAPPFAPWTHDAPPSTRSTLQVGTAGALCATRGRRPGISCAP